MVGNFERVLPSVDPERLATEGVLFLTAVVCSVRVLIVPPLQAWEAPDIAVLDYGRSLRRVAAVGVVGLLLTTTANWSIVRAIYGNRFASHATLHIRFGPNATISDQIKSDKPHP